MTIRFRRSGFCETLEQSYIASNGKLITKDFVDQLNINSMDPDKKYGMTEEESDDMLVWNWAEFLEHHAFTIEERKIAANRLRWFWTRIRFTIWRYRHTVLRAYNPRNNTPRFSILWYGFFHFIPIILILGVESGDFSGNIQWEPTLPGIVVGGFILLFWHIQAVLLGMSAGGMRFIHWHTPTSPAMAFRLPNRADQGKFRPWYGKDRNGDGWVDGREVWYVNPEFHEFIENMSYYKQIDPETGNGPNPHLLSYGYDYSPDLALGFLFEKRFMSTRRKMDEELGIPSLFDHLGEFTKKHDLSYLEDRDRYPFYATIEHSIAFHEHLLDYLVLQFETVLTFRGTPRFSELTRGTHAYGTPGTLSLTLLGDGIDGWFAKDWNMPSFDPSSGSGQPSDFGEFLGRMTDHQLELAAKAIGVSVDGKTRDKLTNDILLYEQMDIERNFSIENPVWRNPPQNAPWYDNHFFSLFRPLVKAIIYVVIPFLFLAFPLMIFLEDGPEAMVFESFVPSGCFLLFVLFFSVVTRGTPVRREVAYQKAIMKNYDGFD